MDAVALYQELILQHYRSSRHRGSLEGPDVVTRLINNPICGDTVTVHLQVDSGRVIGARFEGHGCSISQASASMMAHQVEGASLDEARAIKARFSEMLHGDATAARDSSLGDLRALAGVSRYPARIRCALLAWEALDSLYAGDRTG